MPRTHRHSDSAPSCSGKNGDSTAQGLPPVQNRIIAADRPGWRYGKACKTVAVVLGILLAAAAVFLCFHPQVLVLRDAENGRIYGVWLCPEGEEFAVEFIHSVNLSPVIDTFRAQGDEIRAVKAKFFSFGAGMPTALEPGESFAFTEDGGMEITGITRTYEKLSYIVGTVFDYNLTIGGEQINLRELCGRNAHVELFLW